MILNGHDIRISHDPSAGVWEVFLDGEWIGACDSQSDAREYARNMTTPEFDPYGDPVAPSVEIARALAEHDAWEADHRAGVL